MASPVTPGRSSLERPCLCHRRAECIGLRHDHLSDGPVRRQSAGGEHDAGLLWFGTTLAGFRAIRQRRYADHRQWMLRSVALAFSIMAIRVWLLIAFAVFVPEIYTGAEIDPAA